MSKHTVFIASDHRGFRLKENFVTWLREHSYDPQDLGPVSEDRCDALEFAVKLSLEMKNNPDFVGILICGSGQAMTMTANRYQHLRAALCMNTTMARLSREHNDANVLVLGADIIGQGLALECLETFLETKFLGGRYAERAKSLTDLGGL